MKKAVLTVFACSITAGISYSIWVYSGAGQSILTRWLLRKWKAVAERKQKKLDLKHTEAELNKLTYADVELLFRFTIAEFAGKQRKATRLLKRMDETGIAQRANMQLLVDIILPTNEEMNKRVKSLN
jgi:hypothetical protein